MKKMLWFSLCLCSILFSLPILGGVQALEPASSLSDVLGRSTQDTQTPSPGASATDTLPFSGDDVGSPVFSPADVFASTSSPTPKVEKNDHTLMISVQMGDNVQVFTMHDYLVGVVAAEMPASFHTEALKAQTVAARTYAEYKMRRRADGYADPRHPNADTCGDSTHCKAYLSPEEATARWGSRDPLDLIASCVEATDSEVITYDDEPIVAVFFAISSGKTERAADVWGNDVPYLQSVESPGETQAYKYYGHVELSVSDFLSRLKTEFPDAELGTNPVRFFTNIKRSSAGGVLSLQVGNVTLSGSKMRTLMGLQSTNFTVAATEDKITFDTLGYGHGVGMSQYGAEAMAREGKSYREILTWYYTGVTVSRYYPGD